MPCSRHTGRTAVSNRNSQSMVSRSRILPSFRAVVLVRAIRLAETSASTGRITKPPRRLGLIWAAQVTLREGVVTYEATAGSPRADFLVQRHHDARLRRILCFLVCRLKSGRNRF